MKKTLSKVSMNVRHTVKMYTLYAVWGFQIRCVVQSRRMTEILAFDVFVTFLEN